MGHHLSSTKYRLYITLFLLHFIISLSHAYSTTTTTNCTGTICQSQNIHSGQISCEGAKSCQQSTLTSTNTDGYIECPGYESCYDTVAIKAASDVYCSGSNSCQLSSSIDAANTYCAGTSACSRAKIQIEESIYCYGLYGCSGARIENGVDTFCAGSDSCYNANINGGKSVNCEANEGCYGARITGVTKIGCMGSQSCRSAEVTVANSVRAYGYQSLFYTKITRASSVRAWGYQSLLYVTIDSDGLGRMSVEVYGDSYDSKVICQAGSTCTVTCKGTGCGGITYVCLYGATCNVSPAGCKSDNSVADVNGETCPTFTNTDTVSLESYDTVKNLDDGAIIKADCARCQNCNRKGECAGTAAASGTATRCNGEESCLESTFDSTAVNCEGSRSCADDTFGNDGHENTFCNGYQSCYNARGSIGETGYTGFDYFPCSGEYACAFARLTAGDTACQGAYSCSKSKITAIEYATIDIEGWQAASRSHIDGMLREINVYGYASLYLGCVDTDELIPRQNEIPAITVNLFGHLAGFDGTIICRLGRECTVNCKSTGCWELIFVCQDGAICNVNPVECDVSQKHEGVNCPTMRYVANVDDYMDERQEMKKDVYDRFDEYLVNIMENDNVNSDDYEDIMMFVEDQMILAHDEREMILAQGKVVNNWYNYMDNKSVKLMGGVFIMIGSIMCLWYILTMKQNKEDAYISIN